MSSHLALVIVVISAAVTGCERSDANEPPRRAAAQPVRIAAVTESAVGRPVTGAGTLAAKDELALGFKVGGVIARVLVDAGDRVRRGQVLATLERREIDAAVAKARSAVEKQERDLARFRRLYADSVVTLAQLQDATTARDVAYADLDAATFNQRYATIIAPAAGTVLTKKANAGELVPPGATVLTLASDARGAVVRVGLADRDVVRVRPGNSAVVRFDAYPDRDFRGMVSEIAAASSSGTGTYAIEIALPEARVLPNGLVGRVEIQPADPQRVALVPIEAIVEADGDRGTVYVLAPDAKRAERRAVTIAFTDGHRVAVTRGLDGASRVVTEGAPYLDDGDAVRVLP